MAYNLHFINKRKNSKNNQTNSSARMLPLEEENKFEPIQLPSKGFMDEARKSGVLILENFGLNEIPSEIYRINLGDHKNVTYHGFDEDDSGAWWTDILLRKLSLSSNKIKSISGDIKYLNNLIHLDLQNNQIDCLPQEIEELRQVTYLNLSKNDISDLPKAVGSLEKLENFYVAHNHLHSLPEEFAKLVSLEALDLSNNQFSYIPETIAHFIKLKSLSLSCNYIKELPEGIKKLKDLTFLDVSQNRLTVMPSNFDAKLEIMKVNINCLTQFPIFQCTPSLQELYLSNNLMTTVSERHMSYIPNIKILIMSKNAIIDLPNEISELRYLNHLDVSYNNLESIPCDLGHLVSLQLLNVEGNPFRSIKRIAITNGTEFLKRYLRTRNVKNTNFYKTDTMELIQNDKNESINSFEIDMYEVNSMSTLNLNNKGLKAMPTSFFDSLQSKNIKFVQLSYNKLSDFPSGLMLFGSTLVNLDISFNRIIELPNIFNYFNVIEHLNLSGNHLKILPDTFSCMMNCLKSLNLAFNPLGPKIPKILFKLKSLQYLNASNALISEINPKDFMKLENLIKLELSNNEIDTIPPELGLCQHIKTLSIDGNRMEITKEYANTETLFQYLRSMIKKPS